MNSLLKKRLPGILAVGLTALAVGAAGAPASAAPATTSDGATVSGLNKKQKKAKKKALRKCNKKSGKKKRACRKRVNKKFKKIAKKNSAPQGKTVTVNLGDDFYAPSQVDLKVNDSINWSWANIAGREPHNVTLVTGPSGVSRNDFASPLTADKGFRFKRSFKAAGAYSFVCSIHVLMTMNVNVSR